MRLLVIILFINLLSAGCSEEYECLSSEFPMVDGSIPVENCIEIQKTPCQNDGSEINIRIRNLSRYDLCNLEYDAYDQNRIYGNIPAGGCTCYLTHEKAFRYPANLKYTDFERENTLYAIDFVGEGILEPGRYNYNFWTIITDSIKWNRGYMVPSEDDPDYHEAISHRCEEDAPENCGVDPKQVNLRIVNESIFQLCSFSFLNADREMLSFGNIISGQTTCYIPINYIDKNNFRIEFSIDGIEQGKGLTEPVWRDLVEAGNYTLFVTVGSLNGESIISIFQKDE